jgi:hypothetical protein
MRRLYCGPFAKKTAEAHCVSRYDISYIRPINNGRCPIYLYLHDQQQSNLTFQTLDS